MQHGNWEYAIRWPEGDGWGVTGFHSLAEVIVELSWSLPSKEVDFDVVNITIMEGDRCELSVPLRRFFRWLEVQDVSPRARGDVSRGSGAG